jgi:16S rRNA (cytosine967-C5)-methyltransferase
LADETARIAPEIERAVYDDRKPADRAIRLALRECRGLTPPDTRFLTQAILSLFRWRGWVELLHLEGVEGRLVLSVLLDSETVPSPCRVWASRLGWDPSRLFPLGDAPTWHSRVEGLRQILGDRSIAGDPWRLFPSWLRGHLPAVSDDPKAFHLDFLRALQSPPSLWVRAQGEEPERIWKELAALGLKPWIHRRLTAAARLDRDTEVVRLPPFHRGQLEIQDLSSQVVGLICDPDPGERWWDVCAGTGSRAIHLAALMEGKGVVVASELHEAPLKEAARRARRSPFRNLTTRTWDGKHPVGKLGSYQGILVDPPCTGIGTWRRHPDERWRLGPNAVADFARLQFQILKTAAPGSRPGGSLIYCVPTVTPAETSELLRAFLDTHPEFQLDPFPHPLTGAATDGTLRLWPHQTDGDALFVARLVRS